MALTRPRAYQIYDIDYKQATRVVTTTNISLAGGAPNTVDGISLVANDRVLVTGQTTGSENGIYYVATLGTGSNGTWARSADTSSTGELLSGTIVMVTEGNVFKDTQWKLTTDDPIVIGSTALTFVQNYSANSISAGTSNVVVTSNGAVTISSAGTANVLTVNASSISVAGNIYPTANVTYGLGNTTNRFKDIWLSNSTIYLGNVALSATATTLLVNGINVVTETSGAISVSGNVTGGNLTTAGQVSATGNVTGNYILGNVAFATGIPATYGNSNVAAYLASGTDTSNIITTGNVSGTYILGNVAFATGIPATYGNSNVADYLASGTDTSNIITTGNITGGNLVATTGLSVGTLSLAGNAITSSGSTIIIDPANDGTGGSLIVQGNLSVTGNVTYINSNNVTTNDLTINVANNAATAAAANGGGIGVGPAGAEYASLTYASTSNIWVISNGANVSGNVSATGNISGNYFLGNGRYLTGITGGGGGTVYFQDTAPTSPNSGDVWIVGNTAVQLIYFSDGDSSQWAEMEAFETYGSATVTNVPGGSIYQIQYNNGSGGFGSSANLTFNSNLLSVIGNISASSNISGGNLTTGGLISATGNILGSAKILIGTGASTLTNPVAVFQGSGATYTQVSTFNSTGTGSADLVAYGNNGDDTNSWADIGFTGNAFSDTAYTVTGAGDGYFFTQGNASFGGNMVIATGNVGTTKDIVFATGGFLTGNIKARLYNSTGQFSVVGNVTGGNITTAGIVSASGNIVGASKILIGTGASTLTNPVGVFQGSGATYTQIALFNSTGTGSADLVAYGNNGDDTNSWADIGFTGNTFNDPAYTVTAAGDGYFFTQGNASFGGNMVIATGNVGTTKDIIFATGGFQTGNIKARLFNSTGQFSVTGNIAGNYILGNGSQLTGLPATYGNPNVVTLLAAFGSNTIYTTGTVTLGGIVNANANGIGNIGSQLSYFNTVFAQATSAQYADLAENYESDEYYEPGTVLMFGGNMEITLAQEDTTAIAGVVSTNPAHLMNASCPGISLPIALQGRVPCKVTGSIRKGDLMIAAANGYAKSTKTPVIGQVIGKALENFEGVQGVIEIAVGRL